jgi:phosphate acetyltransferase
MDFITTIRSRVKETGKKRIVFPEGEDMRILSAACYLSNEQMSHSIVLGNESEIKKRAAENSLNLGTLEIIDLPRINKEDFSKQYYEIRKNKGMDLQKATEIMNDPLFYAAMMIRNNQADCAVGGAINPTGNVLRAAIQIVGLAQNITAVSSSFFMVLKDGKVLSFGDCAVIPNPDEQQLAAIALSTADTFEKVVHEKANVAMLSFSTKGSAEHDDVFKVVNAMNLIKQLKPELNIDGELQFDAAYNPKVGSMKAPDSLVAGKANVYIFPDLDSGNIGYKIAQRLGEAEAIGPIIQGLAKPFNDLSRGCNTEDVINTACICSLMV